jgi:hypothetical protein
MSGMPMTRVKLGMIVVGVCGALAVVLAIGAIGKGIKKTLTPLDIQNAQEIPMKEFREKTPEDLSSRLLNKPIRLKGQVQSLDEDGALVVIFDGPSVVHCRFSKDDAASTAGLKKDDNVIIVGLYCGHTDPNHPLLTPCKLMEKNGKPLDSPP